MVFGTDGPTDLNDRRLTGRQAGLGHPIKIASPHTSARGTRRTAQATSLFPSLYSRVRRLSSKSMGPAIWANATGRRLDRRRELIVIPPRDHAPSTRSDTEGRPYKHAYPPSTALRACNTWLRKPSGRESKTADNAPTVRTAMCHKPTGPAGTSERAKNGGGRNNSHTAPGQCQPADASEPLMERGQMSLQHPPAHRGPSCGGSRSTTFGYPAVRRNAHHRACCTRVLQTKSKGFPEHTHTYRYACMLSFPRPPKQLSRPPHSQASSHMQRAHRTHQAESPTDGPTNHENCGLNDGHLCCALDVVYLGCSCISGRWASTCVQRQASSANATCCGGATYCGKEAGRQGVRHRLPTLEAPSPSRAGPKQHMLVGGAPRAGGAPRRSAAPTAPTRCPTTATKRKEWQATSQRRQCRGARPSPRARHATRNCLARGGGRRPRATVAPRRSAGAAPAAMALRMAAANATHRSVSAATLALSAIRRATDATERGAGARAHGGRAHTQAAGQLGP